MMKSAPASPFVRTQAQFLFQFLIVTFDNPTVFGDSYPILQLRCWRKRRYPVFGRLRISFRPFQQQPWFGEGFGSFVIPMGNAYPDGGKARAQIPVAFPPAICCGGTSRAAMPKPTASLKRADDPRCVAAVSEDARLSSWIWQAEVADQAPRPLPKTEYPRPRVVAAAREGTILAGQREP